MTTKTRDTNWSRDESQLLVEFVKEQRARELFGSSGGGERAPHNIVSIKRGIWEQAAQNLHESGGPKRHWIKIRKKWGELASKARKYRRETEKTGGGEQPKVDPFLEQVLDVLAPASKDGVIPRGKGESFPILQQTGPTQIQLLSSPMTTAHDEEEEDDDDDDDDDHNKDKVEDTVQEGDEQTVEEGDGRGGPSSPKPKHPSRKRPVMGSVVEIESARLQVEQDRLLLEREQLEAVRNIQSSLVDINTNMQMLLAVICNHQGVTLVGNNEN